jgi:septal ring factor EnvC (AmiA/AmiB activator)
VPAEAIIQQLKQQAGGVQAELQQARIGYDQASEELKAAAADRDESAANLAHLELQLQEQEVRC